MEADMASDSSAASANDAESAMGLVGRLLHEATALLRNEVALARAEFADSVSNLKRGAGVMAAAGALLLAGALSLVAAAILGLAEVLAPWLAALIVGVVLGIVGLVLLQAAKRKLEPSNLAMQRTQHALRRDAELVARRT